uniref:Non-histone chromosomal protein HMG-14 n=1 Tax=Anas zonorhyncha TaxID=75864 RepID=A0A8B9VH30_9AVES
MHLKGDQRSSLQLRSISALHSRHLLKLNLPRKSDKSEDKKAQSKGKKGPKGKQTEETNQEQTKDNLPAENGETKSEEVNLGEKCICFLGR